MSFRSPVFFETQHKSVYQNFLWPLSIVVTSVTNERELSCFNEVVSTVRTKFI